MPSLIRSLPAFIVAFTGAIASAQIVPVGPFQGMSSEGFETQTSGVFTTCVQGRVFGNLAELCDPMGNAAHITSGWSFFCTIYPQSGGRLFGSAGGPAELTFDEPVLRFGSYFGTNSHLAGAQAEFYDATGVLLASLPVTAPADCTWTWNGWHVTSGPAIRRIKITGNSGFNGGGFIQMDGMEVDFGAYCFHPITYCTAKFNSLGCLPAMDSIGVPSASSPQGFIVGASNVRNNKPGLLMYGTNGPANTPFQGGTLCVNAPVQRTEGLNSGGNPPPDNDCSGWYWIDMNNFAQGGLGGQPDPLLRIVGTVVHCQYWGRDPGFPAPGNTTLSDGLHYVVCP